MDADDLARTEELAARLLAAENLTECAQILDAATEQLNEPGYADRIVHLIGGILGGFHAVLHTHHEEFQEAIRNRFALIADVRGMGPKLKDLRPEDFA